jgi:hypothetical protein
MTDVAKSTGTTKANLTIEFWENRNKRQVRFQPLPVGIDGVHRTFPVETTKMEARFLAAVLAFADEALINKALEYAASDRA